METYKDRKHVEQTAQSLIDALSKLDPQTKLVFGVPSYGMSVYEQAIVLPPGGKRAEAIIEISKLMA